MLWEVSEVAQKQQLRLPGPALGAQWRLVLAASVAALGNKCVCEDKVS